MILLKPVFIIVMAIVLLIPTSAFAQSSEHWSDELYTWYDYRLIEESQLNNALIYLQDREIIEIVIHSTEPADFIVSVLEPRRGGADTTVSTISTDNYEDTKSCFDTLSVDGLTVEEKSVCQRIHRQYVETIVFDKSSAITIANMIPAKGNSAIQTYGDSDYSSYNNYGYDNYGYDFNMDAEVQYALNRADYYAYQSLDAMDTYANQWVNGEISYGEYERKAMASQEYYGNQYAYEMDSYWDSKYGYYP